MRLPLLGMAKGEKIASSHFTTLPTLPLLIAIPYSWKPGVRIANFCTRVLFLRAEKQPIWHIIKNNPFHLVSSRWQLIVISFKIYLYKLMFTCIKQRTASLISPYMLICNKVQKWQEQYSVYYYFAFIFIYLFIVGIYWLPLFSWTIYFSKDQ